MYSIDIEQIIYCKCGIRAPEFIISPLRRLIHEEEINTLLDSGKGMSPKEFLQHICHSFQTTYTLHGSLPPASGRYMFVANHPFGGLDGILLANILLQKWDDAGVIVNDLLMHIKPLQKLWIPVNKFGHQNIPATNLYHQALNSPTKQILTFPAGLCSRYIGGKVTDLEWSPRFFRDAMRYNRTIIPIYVEGALSNRFYNIFRLRQRLGIRLNVELLLLIDEMFRQQGKHIHIHVGPPINPKSLTKDIASNCATIRHMVEDLANRHIF